MAGDNIAFHTLISHPRQSFWRLATELYLTPWQGPKLSNVDCAYNWTGEFMVKSLPCPLDRKRDVQKGRFFQEWKWHYGVVLV
jgi:hypothetical protein